MRSLLARAAVGIAIVLFAASSASWQMEPVSAQAPTPTPVPGSPTVMIQVDDDKVVVGDPVRITIIAFDDEAVDWVRWQARFADSDNDNDAGDNADNDEGDNGNDNDDDVDADLLTTPDPATDNSADDDEDNQNENDNDSAIDNDNIDPSADPGLAAVHEFECDEQTACANVWTITTMTTGRYEIIAEVRDTTGLRGTTRMEIEVRQRR